MIIFLAACAVIGLWAPSRAKLGKLIFLLAAALVVIFVLFPNKL
jgi:hypothetical protein